MNRSEVPESRLGCLDARAAAQPHGSNVGLDEFSFVRFSCMVIDQLFLVFSYTPIEFVY